MKRLRRLRSILLLVALVIGAVGLVAYPNHPVFLAVMAVAGAITTYSGVNEILDRFGGQPKRAPRQSFPSEQNYLEGRLRYFAREREFFVALAGNTEIKTGLDAFDKDFRPQQPGAPSKEYEDIAQAAADYSRFVIVGDPGAGKSTSLKNLAESAVRARLNSNLPSDGARVPLPLWIDLGYSSNPLDAEELLEFWWAEYGLPGNAHAALKAFDIWLFLDGLNEMPEGGGSRADRAKSLKELLEAHRDMHTVVTCRVRDYEGFLDLSLPVVYVRPLDMPRIEEFVRLRLKEKVTALLEVIAANKALESNASNPYTLVMLIKVFESDRLREVLKDPNLYTLYGQYVRARYDEYRTRQYSDDKDERKRTDTTRLLKLSWEPLESKMQDLAFRMVADSKGTVADARWTQRRIGLRATRDGINLGVLVQEDDSIRFFHQSLHSYFALPGLTRALERRWYDSIFANRRRQFIAGIGDLGEAAAPAAPVIIAALKYGDNLVRLEAAEALGHIGPPTVPALIGALKDHNEWVRGRAAEVLEHIGPPSVPALIGALKDDADEVRYLAAEALGHIGPSAVPALTTALKNSDDGLRWRAAWTLGRIGPPAVDAVPALIGALKDSDGWVRYLAAEALGHIGTPAAEAVHALITALNDDADEVRRAAALTLGRIGPPAVDAVPALIGALKDHNEWVRYLAAEALGHIGTPAAEAVPALTTALKNSDDGLRWRAAWTLGRIRPLAAGVVPALITALKDSDNEVRWRAADALEYIGTPEALAAVKAWREG